MPPVGGERKGGRRPPAFVLKIGLQPISLIIMPPAGGEREEHEPLVRAEEWLSPFFQDYNAALSAAKGEVYVRRKKNGSQITPA